MKKAFYGGTFNPPHLGHIRLGAAVLEYGYADRVIFAPAWLPPHKRNEEIVPFADRMKMLELAIEGERRFSVSDIERERGGVSYTLETLRMLSERFPGDEFVLLIGADSLAQLHSWYKAHELVAEYGILSYPRSGETVTVDLLKRDWNGSETEKLLRGVIAGAPVIDISSSEIRAGLLENGSLSDKLNQNVLNYIKRRRLYES